MHSRRTARLVAIAVAGWLAVGIGYPYLDLALACRLPQSEACVWGKAYFPLTMGLSLVLSGALAAAVVYAVLAWWRRGNRDD